MANAIFPAYKTAILSASANVSLTVDDATDGPFIALVDTGTYTYSAAHDFYNDLSGIVGTDQRLDNPTVGSVSAGTFDADNVTFTAVSGATVEALVIYRHNSGANTTWRLVAYIDTSVTGLPVTPNGGDISVSWSASGIFTISDRRLKMDIQQIGKVRDLPVYSYRYLWSEKRHTGLMAQDVEKIAPHAVVDVGAFKAVDYSLALAA